MPQSRPIHVQGWRTRSTSMGDLPSTHVTLMSVWTLSEHVRNVQSGTSICVKKKHKLKGYRCGLTRTCKSCHSTIQTIFRHFLRPSSPCGTSGILVAFQNLLKRCREPCSFFFSALSGNSFTVASCSFVAIAEGWIPWASRRSLTLPMYVVCVSGRSGFSSDLRKAPKSTRVRVLHS